MAALVSLIVSHFATVPVTRGCLVLCPGGPNRPASADSRRGPDPVRRPAHTPSPPGRKTAAVAVNTAASFSRIRWSGRKSMTTPVPSTGERSSQGQAAAAARNQCRSSAATSAARPPHHLKVGVQGHQADAPAGTRDPRARPRRRTITSPACSAAPETTGTRAPGKPARTPHSSSGSAAPAAPPSAASTYAARPSAAPARTARRRPLVLARQPAEHLRGEIQQPGPDLRDLLRGHTRG
jgi:hypothetical protein